MTKVEKPSAINHLEQIIELSDGLMVARGDLGVEMPLEACAGPAKTYNAGLPAGRQAGCDRNPNAGIDDNRACADPG